MLKKALLLVTISLSASCAHLGLHSSDEDAVAKRADKRLQALQQLDYQTAYGYMSPGYRSTNNLNQFSANYSGARQMVSYEITQVTCESEDVCQAHVTINYNSSILGIGSPTDESYVIDHATKQTWVKLNNTWWFSK